MFLATVGWAQSGGMIGTWQGTLNAGGMKLRLAFHIAANDQGGYTTTWDSLDQNVTGMPVPETTVAGNKLHLNIPRSHAQYDGTLNGDEIAGTFTQGVAMPLNLKRVDKIEGPNRPQEPKGPFPYDSEDVGYENKGIHLAGTLTMPHGEGPFPAALMVTGSGPQDRDETLFGHKPFWVIADFLTRRGIAVLRLDDRGVGKSTGNSTQATLDDMAGDVLAGIAFLRAHKGINRKQIGVIGHSEGGMVGPLAASKSSDLAFVVMLAGPGVSFQQAIDSHQSQAELMMRQAGASQQAIDWNNAVQNMIIRVLRLEPDGKTALSKMQAEQEKMKVTLPDTLRKAMDNPAAVAASNRNFASVVTPEMRTILLFDPGEVLRKVKVPVLAMNGSRDLQIYAKQNLPAIAAALADGGNNDFTIVDLPGLNHLFQKCDKCTVAEYGELEETFSPAALTLLGEWLIHHTRE